jgi:yeast amino acid transporter
LQAHYATRWLDPAIGFALGYNYWYTYAIMVPTEITAASIVISYWDSKTNPGAWITILLAAVVFFNLYAVFYARWSSFPLT